MALPEIFSNPVLYDYGGLLVFTYITYLGWRMIKRKKIEKWMKWALLVVGIIGLVVDATLVTFFGKIFSIVQ